MYVGLGEAGNPDSIVPVPGVKEHSVALAMKFT